MSRYKMELAAISEAQLVPVITIRNADVALDLASAILRAGISVIEITLRTDAGLASIKRIKEAGLDMLVGAGSVRRMGDIEASIAAGADFLVTPATPAMLIPALKASGKLVLPGVATPTEALALSMEGFEVQKIFPAELLGGPSYVNSLAAPLPELNLMPSGGITIENAASYLNLPNVVAVGASWFAPADIQEVGNWAQVESAVASAKKRVVATS